MWVRDLIFHMLSSGQSDSWELIQSVSRGDMLSRCFKEALRLELTYSDLHFSSPFPKTHSLMSWAWGGAAFAVKQINPIKAKSYSHLSQRKTGQKISCWLPVICDLTQGWNAAAKPLRKWESNEKGCLTGTHELLMMFVFIQFCFHIICQSRIWCKGCEQRLQILFPEAVSLVTLKTC